MAARTQERLDRARERKRLGAKGWSVVPGRSILQLMQDHLDMRVSEYMDVKNTDVPTLEKVKLRAGVDGIAECVGIMKWPYEQIGVGNGESGKMALQESLRRVKDERKKREWLSGRESQ